MGLNNYFIILLCNLACFAKANSCYVLAIINDPDPAGTNLRSGPSSKDSVVKLFKSQEGTSVSIDKCENGWCHVNSYFDSENDEKIQGWIFSKLLTVDLKPEVSTGLYRAKLYEQNDLKSKMIGQDEFKNIQVLDCHKDWLKVSVSLKNKKREGWISSKDYCGNALTTCP